MILLLQTKSIYKITRFSSIINLINTAKFCYNMGITKPCTHLHPAPSRSIHLHPAHFSLHSALCNTLNNIIRNWAIFPNLGRKIRKLSILIENWHTWYIGGVDSESRLRFLKFGSQNLFLGKFGPKNSKLSILSENWYTWYLKDADSYSNISFLNFKS